MKHGFAGRDKAGRHPLYGTWCDMKKRCSNPNYRQYADYGGRGIKVCDEWANSFAAFVKDMGPRPSKRHSIDRVDNDKGYTPENCRWATKEEQSLNTRRTRLVPFNGEMVPLKAVAKATGQHHTSITRKLDLGMPMSAVLTKLKKPRRALSTTEIEEIRRLRKSGRSQASIARQFGVSQSYVWKLVQVVEIAHASA